MEENKVSMFASLDDLLTASTELVKGFVEVQLKNGTMVKLPITSIEPDKEKEIRKQSTRWINGRNGRHSELDDLKYNCLLISAATDTNQTDIRWNSPELQKKFNLPVPAPDMIIPKILSFGGIVKAAQAITQLSGIDESLDDKVEAIKN